MGLDQPDQIDVMGARRGGGADLVVLVDERLDNEPATQRRLLDKLETYFGFANSDEFRSECGPPSPESTCVVVRCGAEPDPVIRQLIANAEGWAKDNNVSLRLEVRSRSP